MSPNRPVVANHCPRRARTGGGGHRRGRSSRRTTIPQNDHTDAAGASSDTTTDAPTVPVFCHVPEAAAERAVRRVRQYREADDEDLFEPQPESTLRDFVLDEIRQQPVTYVGGQPLAAWADEHADDIDPGEV